MKKTILFPLVLTIAFTTTIYADPYAELDTDKGVLDILGCETYSNDDGDFVYVFAQYENKTDESAYPDTDFFVKAYQDGIELDYGYVYTGEYVPEGYKDSMTSVRPGATIKFYTIFTLDNTESPIDVEVKDWDEGFADCTLSLTGDVAEASENIYASEPTETGTETVDETTLDENIIATLTERIDELERRVAALEAK